MIGGDKVKVFRDEFLFVVEFITKLVTNHVHHQFGDEIVICCKVDDE